jgi:branched-chain amino acid transport system substrate-binding protein
MKGKKGEKNLGMSRRSFIKAAGITGAATILGFPAIVKSQPKEITIGLVTGLTGPAADFGVYAHQGLQLVFDEVNAAGGIKSMKGAKIKLVVYDAQFKHDIEQSQLKRMLDADPVLIIDGGSSQGALMFAPVAEKTKMIHVVMLGLGSGIAEAGPRYTFQVSLRVDKLADDATSFVKEMAEKTNVIPKKVAIMGEDSYFGQSGAKGFRAVVEKEKNWELVDYFIYPSAQPDFSTVISKYKAAGVDVVFQANYVRDSILIMKTVKMLDYNPMCIIGVAGGSDVPEFLTQLGSTANYFFNTSVCNQDLAENPKIKPIAERYIARFNKPLFQNNAMGLTTGGTVVDALERAGTTDREKLREAMKATNLKTGDSYVVAVGGVAFGGQDGTNTAIRGIVFQALDGKRYTVWPDEYDSKKPVWPRPKWKDIG